MNRESRRRYSNHYCSLRLLCNDGEMRLILALAAFLVPLSISAAESARFKWIRSATSSKYVDAVKLHIDPGGNLFVTGYFGENVDFGGIILTNPTTHWAAFCVKYSSLGDLGDAWSLVGPSDVSIVDMAFDENGSCYMTGYFFDSIQIGSFKLAGSTTASTGYLAKRLKSGIFEWVIETYPDSSGLHLLLDSKKQIWLNSIASQFFPWHFSKWTSSGEKLWQIDNPLSRTGYFKRIALLEDDSALAIYGNVYAWTPGLSLMRLTSDGTISATNQILSPTGTVFENSALPSMIFDDRRNIVFSGVEKSVGVYKYSATGLFLWARTNDLPDYVTSGIGPSGYIYVAGSSIDPPPPNTPLFFRLYKPTGEEVLTKTVPGQVGATGVAIDINGTAYIAGNIQGEASFDGFNISVPISYPSRGMFLAALDIPYAPPAFEAVNTVFSRNVDELFTFTNIAFSTHPLTYRIQSNSLAGLFFNSKDGSISWTPATNYAGTTNLVTIIAADTLSPSITATQRLTVIVSDLITIRTGSVGANAGTKADIPVILTSSASLTNLSFDLEIPETSAEMISVLSESAQIEGTITKVAESRYHFSLTPKASPFLQGTNSITLRALTSVPARSLIQDLTFQNLAAINLENSLVTDIRPLNGRLFLIDREPLLEVGGLKSGMFDLRLYGDIGIEYSIQSTESLGSSWNAAASATVKNLPETLQIPLNQGWRFYRAVRVTARYQ
jgi:hypothetical protein